MDKTLKRILINLCIVIGVGALFNMDWQPKHQPVAPTGPVDLEIESYEPDLLDGELVALMPDEKELVMNHLNSNEEEETPFFHMVLESDINTTLTGGSEPFPPYAENWETEKFSKMKMTFFDLDFVSIDNKLDNASYFKLENSNKVYVYPYSPDAEATNNFVNITDNINPDEELNIYSGIYNDIDSYVITQAMYNPEVGSMPMFIYLDKDDFNPLFYQVKYKGENLISVDFKIDTEEFGDDVFTVDPNWEKIDVKDNQEAMEKIAIEIQ